MKKRAIFISLLLLFFGNPAFAINEDKYLNELVDQLKGKDCKCEIQGDACVNRKPSAFLSRRHDREECLVDAAEALGLMGPRAKSAVPALIEMLNKYHNIDTGDGIIPLRSEIVRSLGKIGDPSAIKPLIAILASASTPAWWYKFEKGSFYGVVVRVLGTFGPQAKEALPILNALMANEQKKLKVDRADIEEAIQKINK